MKPILLATDGSPTAEEATKKAIELAAKKQAKQVAGEAAATARAEGVSAQTVLLRGFPVEEISAAAEKFDPQLIVLGSHGWSAMKRMLFGSVSTGVLHHTSVPVLVVPAPAEDRPKKSEEALEEVTA